MDAFIFQGALYCADCTAKILAELQAQGKVPANVADESAYDSDEYPKGPYPHGGGEADSPQHCDDCGEFLENPLTDDGVNYVRQAIAECADPERVARALWSPFYNLCA